MIGLSVLICIDSKLMSMIELARHDFFFFKSLVVFFLCN